MVTRARPIGITLFGITQIAVSVLFIILATTFIFVPLLEAYAVATLITNIITLILGIEFLTHEKRGRTFILLSGIFDLVSILPPVGTALGVVILWYLTKPRVKNYFSRI